MKPCGSQWTMNVETGGSRSSARLHGRRAFRLLVDAVTNYAIYVLDATGHIASWNAGAQLFKG
jgi:hypothetical protein